MSDNQVMGFGLDWIDVARKLLRYIFLGLSVALSAYMIPSKKLSMEEVITLAITSSAVFAILDIYSPAISGATKFGVGLGLGTGLVPLAML